MNQRPENQLDAAPLERLQTGTLHTGTLRLLASKLTVESDSGEPTVCSSQSWPVSLERLNVPFSAVHVPWITSMAEPAAAPVSPVSVT